MPPRSAIQAAAEAGILREINVKQRIKDILAAPDEFADDPQFGPFARELATANADAAAALPGGQAPDGVYEPIQYRTWGDAGIDGASHAQMRQACALPMAVGAALMPDAHVGYGLPIGGVLALWITPSCRMPWAWISPAA